MKLPYGYAYLIAVALLLTGCSANGDDTLPADALATFGSNTLTRRQLNRDMPSGLTPDDSIAFARAYIRHWAETMIIDNIAAAEVNIAEIDRLTEEYRRELIMNQYRRAMAGQINGHFAEDSLKAYYDTHLSTFELERPLIKGIYLKVPSDARQLWQVRQLYRSDQPGDIDRLEKVANTAAVHYDYFRDRWVDWEQIENRVPMSTENVRTLEINKYLEFESQGFIYFLVISDYVPAGQTMPYEAARELIRERLLAQCRNAYDAELRASMLSDAVASGELTIF